MIWCLIPARKNSVGVPDKNIRPLPDGSTLIERAMTSASWFLPGDGLARMVISTDYSFEELAHASRYTRLADLPDPRVVRQPPLCASGVGSMLALMIHAMLEVGAAAEDVVLLLQPTSPFRSVETGRKVLSALIVSDSACSVMPYPTTWHPRYAIGADGTWDPPTRRQELEPAYRPDGGYYATTIRQIVTGSWGRMATVLSGPDESLTIDSLDDWATAERRIAAERR